MKKKKESEGWEMVIGTYLMSMSLNTAPPESVGRHSTVVDANQTWMIRLPLEQLGQHTREALAGGFCTTSALPSTRPTGGRGFLQLSHLGRRSRMADNNHDPGP